MKWNLRLAAANRGVWKASELQHMLAERGLPADLVVGIDAHGREGADVLISYLSEDEDAQDAVIDLVDDAVITGPYTPLARAADELLRVGRPRVGGKQVDRGPDLTAGRTVELAQLTRGGRGELDPEGHAMPRSALTCSHGIAPSTSISSRAARAASMSARSGFHPLPSSHR